MINQKKFFYKNGYKFILLLPGFCLFMFAIVIPFFMGLNISFTDWDGLSQTYNYVLFDNYIQIFKSPAILKPLANTLLYGIFGAFFNNIVSLGLAMLIARKIKTANIVKTIFFIPVCLSTVLVAFIWKFIYSEIFSAFGMNNPLGNPTLALPSILVMSLWSTVGINMLIYLAALKNVPIDLYEASVVDGASSMKRFVNVTLPMIVPAFTTCITLTLTSYMREFALTLSATGGGPTGASESVSIYIYKNFYEYSKAGYAQAVSILFMVVLIVIGLTVSSVLRNKEVEQ